MQPDRPNFLLVHCHDLGTELGAYGRPGVQSPSLDALAATAWRFDNAFCTAPQCSPSRGSLFTGRYPHANGLMGLAHLGWEYHPDERTLPDLLRPAGYRSALVGLQHESADATTLGFDEVDSPEPKLGADEVAARASAWLAVPRREPFLLTVGLTEAHRPFTHPPLEDEPAAVPAYLPDHPGTREDLAAFHGSVKVADAAVGAVLDALDRSPHADSTWVVFTTDHGPAFPRAKGTLYDPGLRVALLVRPPRRSRSAGGVVERAVSLVDFVPTVLELAGLAVPSRVQGRSFAPLLRGEPMVPAEVVYAEKTSHRGYDPMRCVRALGFKYIRSYEPRPRLVLPTDIEASPTRRGMGEEHLRPRDAEELYDLESDPDEQCNLASDPAYAMIRSRLGAALERWQRATGDPLLHGPIAEPPLPGRTTGALVQNGRP
ncbi:sulfatase [Desertihabitans brevis]|uniref:Sulfatase n=1 Tax=Desertihabitans brevis TaxID=2268447 RepID=A0A367YW90_9ACTN|nr:sulfatase [Desertihabitans brevis]RCK70080.1 sulfatase [Desertihabitans brevis]